MKIIPLTKGYFALVDDADYEWINSFEWAADDGYAVREYVDHATGERSTIPMHRVIMGLEQGDPRRIDHVDMIRGNNQRYNLRIATHTQNMWNRPAQKNNTSGYKGVTWHRQALRWQARIRANKKTISLGLFDTPREAHEAYKTAADKYHGEFANYG